MPLNLAIFLLLLLLNIFKSIDTCDSNSTWQKFSSLFFSRFPVSSPAGPGNFRFTWWSKWVFIIFLFVCFGDKRLSFKILLHNILSDTPEGLIWLDAFRVMFGSLSVGLISTDDEGVLWVVVFLLWVVSICALSPTFDDDVISGKSNWEST